MAVPSPSSSPFSETEAKLHPYQTDTNGPKGAYEARKVEGGLYVRVDMPGVPPDNIKVFKNSEQRTVSFTGKSPPKLATITNNKIWFNHEDACYRVYGGYVALDRDPADVEVKYEVKDGCLRLFFPDSDGSLHFLSRPSRADGGGVTVTPSHDPSDLGGDEALLKFIQLTFGDTLGRSGLRLKSGKEEDINPYVLSWPKGVYDPTVLKEADGDGMQFYVRLDVPGASNEAYEITEKDGCLIASARGLKDSPFDEGGREYSCMWNSKCTCCPYKVVNHELKNGVLRYLVRWAPNRSHRLLPPRRRREPGRPSTLRSGLSIGKPLSFLVVSKSQFI